MAMVNESLVAAVAHARGCVGSGESDVKRAMNHVFIDRGYIIATDGHLMLVARDPGDPGVGVIERDNAMHGNRRGKPVVRRTLSPSQQEALTAIQSVAKASHGYDRTRRCVSFCSSSLRAMLQAMEDLSARTLTLQLPPEDYVSEMSDGQEPVSVRVTGKDQEVSGVVMCMIEGDESGPFDKYQALLELGEEPPPIVELVF